MKPSSCIAWRAWLHCSLTPRGLLLSTMALCSTRVGSKTRFTPELGHAPPPNITLTLAAPAETQPWRACSLLQHSGALASILMAVFISWLQPEGPGPLRGSDVFNVPWGTGSGSVNNGFIIWLIIDETAHHGQKRDGILEIHGNNSQWGETIWDLLRDILQDYYRILNGYEEINDNACSPPI